MSDLAVHIPAEEIDAFCRHHGVRRLAVFGSAVRDDFGPNSDIDVLVEFRDGRAPGLMAFVRMEDELAQLLGRKVDLVSRSGCRRCIARDVLAGAAGGTDAA